MTAESLVRRWFTEVWNAKNAAAIDQFLSDDAVVHGVAPDALHGAD